jgi:hypothetical protein
MRVNRAFNGEANRLVSDRGDMIFDDIHKHHGMTRTHQRGTHSAANGAGTPDQDGAMIHRFTDGALFGFACHCNLLGRAGCRNAPSLAKGKAWPQGVRAPIRGITRLPLPYLCRP